MAKIKIDNLDYRRYFRSPVRDEMFIAANVTQNFKPHRGDMFNIPLLKELEII